jgi:hypothetical protein
MRKYGVLARDRRLDDGGIRQGEVAAGWTDADGLHLVVGDRMVEPQIDRPTPAIDSMAMRASWYGGKTWPELRGLADSGRIDEPTLPGDRGRRTMGRVFPHLSRPGE